MSYNQYVQPPSIYGDEIKKNIATNSLKVTGKSVLKDITANSIQVSEPLAFDELVLTSATITNLKLLNPIVTENISGTTLTITGNSTLGNTTVSGELNVNSLNFDNIYGNNPFSKKVGNLIQENVPSVQGRSVSLSSDGYTVAVGSPSENSNKGSVRVYNFNGTDWQLKGNIINENLTNAHQGHSVSISSNGNSVAVGSYTEDSGRGATRVYIWNGTDWETKGNRIQESVYGQQGCSVSMTPDGNTIIIGACSTSGGGAARVYTWNGASWAIKGSIIQETVPGNPVQGYSVAITPDGNTVAVGAPQQNMLKGATRVYSWNGTSWQKKGLTIQENVDEAWQGNSVALSSDGNIVAIGAPEEDFSSGAVRIYTWNGTSWQLTTKIQESGDNKWQGWSISATEDLGIIAVSSIIEDSSVGCVRLYRKNGNSWELINKIQENYPINSFQGSSVSITPDGSFIAVGAEGYETTGAVNVYNFTKAEINSDSITTKNVYTEELTVNKNVNIPGNLNVTGNTFLSSATIGNLSLSQPLSFDNLDLTNLKVSNLNTSNVIDSQNILIKGLYAKDAGEYQNEPDYILTNGSNQYKAVAISKDGKTLALGDYSQNVVFVYTFIEEDSSWFLEETFNGQPASDYGYSVALSADGKILAIGGRSADTGRGAVWIHTKPGTNWDTGEILIDSSVETDSAKQGYSVALSYYGDVLVVGGPTYQIDKGAIWIYKRNGSVWSLDSRLESSVASGLGVSVAVSNDGSVVAAGCPSLNSIGGVIVYKKDGNNVWQPVVVSDSDYTDTLQGISVSLSGDGNILAFGGEAFNSNRGGVWVYKYVGGSWEFDTFFTQSEAINANIGCSVSISNDGNTLVAGGKGLAPYGLTLVYSRRNNIWETSPITLTQETDSELSNQGYAVSVSGNGNYVVVCDEYLRVRIYRADFMYIEPRQIYSKYMFSKFTTTNDLTTSVLKVPSSGTCGTVDLVDGTATVEVADIFTDTKIFLTIQQPLGTIGIVHISNIEPGTGFTITSTSLTDTSKVAYFIVRY